MKLIDVRNGHYFIKPMFPCEIFQRICDITGQYGDFVEVSGAEQTKIEAKLLNDGKTYVFFQPRKTEVIGLGK
tara:strand:- start:665 stop:883 length:219 start_codon:yes stop_codon:yes gene_type:complete